MNAGINDVMKLHMNAAVEQRAKEIEAYLLAWMRVTGLNVADLQLVEDRTEFPMRTKYCLEVRK